MSRSQKFRFFGRGTFPARSRLCVARSSRVTVIVHESLWRSRDCARSARLSAAASTGLLLRPRILSPGRTCGIISVPTAVTRHCSSTVMRSSFSSTTSNDDMAVRRCLMQRLARAGRVVTTMGLERVPRESNVGSPADRMSGAAADQRRPSAFRSCGRLRECRESLSCRHLRGA